jgi:hypothetical protein
VVEDAYKSNPVVTHSCLKAPRGDPTLESLYLPVSNFAFSNGVNMYRSTSWEAVADDICGRISAEAASSADAAPPPSRVAVKNCIVAIAERVAHCAPQPGGDPVQVELVLTQSLKAPGFKPLSLSSEKLVSSLCFQMQLVPLRPGCDEWDTLADETEDRVWLWRVRDLKLLAHCGRGAVQAEMQLTQRLKPPGSNP